MRLNKKQSQFSLLRKYLGYKVRHLMDKTHNFVGYITVLNDKTEHINLLPI